MDPVLPTGARAAQAGHAVGGVGAKPDVGHAEEHGCAGVCAYLCVCVCVSACVCEYGRVLCV